MSNTNPVLYPLYLAIRALFGRALVFFPTPTVHPDFLLSNLLDSYSPFYPPPSFLLQSILSNPCSPFSKLFFPPSFLLSHSFLSTPLPSFLNSYLPLSFLLPPPCSPSLPSPPSFYSCPPSYSSLSFLLSFFLTSPSPLPTTPYSILLIFVITFMNLKIIWI